MAYTLPLSKAAKKLAKTRPASSLLGTQTVSSVVGVFLFHLIFTIVALFCLFNTSWFPCRKWTSNDVRAMSLAEYQRLGNSAFQAYYNRQHRLAADNYLAALSHCPDKWEPNRWQVFEGYTSILREKYFTPTQDDLDALDRFVNDTHDSVAPCCACP